MGIPQALAVVIGVLFVTSVAWVTVRHRRRMVTRDLDPADEERARAWRSLSLEQRQTAKAQTRRGQAISDPEVAALVLSSVQSDTAFPPRFLVLLNLFGVVVASSLVSFGIAEHVRVLIIIGGVCGVNFAGSALWFYSVRARIRRSLNATVALHGSQHA